MNSRQYGGPKHDGVGQEGTVESGLLGEGSQIVCPEMNYYAPFGEIRTELLNKVVCLGFVRMNFELMCFV